MHRTATLITPVLLCLLCTLLLGACQSVPDKPLPPVPAPVLPPAPPAPPPPEPVLDNFNDIVEALQNGAQDIAERSLQAMLERGQYRNAARRLLQQIHTDPQQLLGAEHRQITVQAGDTLSMLAQRYLGDPLLFYALARYNDIAIPRLLSVGQQLKIPLSQGAGNSAVGMTDQRSEQERLATFLLASGETRTGWRTLLQAAHDQQLSVAGMQQLYELSLKLAELAINGQQGEIAISTLQSALEAFDQDDVRQQQLARRLLRTRAMAKLQASAAAAAKDNLELAWQLAAEAADIDPDYAQARAEAARLKAALVQTLHENALRHWRDREVPEAIALWEQLLSVQSDFEPASVYLQRAREMAAKLDANRIFSDE